MSAGLVPPTSEHGGDALWVAVALGLDPTQVIDLSASMNPFAPDVADLLTGDRDLVHAVIGRYPRQANCAERLAEVIGVDPQRLVLTNGGAEAIALVAAETGAGWVEEPEFSLYRRSLAVVDRAEPRWRSNPSSSLGALAGSDECAGVWDEAFYPIATGAWTRGDDSAWRLGSLTKLWNCPVYGSAT